jgi:hypothetical protein
MSDKLATETRTEAKSSTQPPSIAHNTLSKSQAVTICAVGLLVCFFLPWITFFGAGASGFDIQKADEKAKVLWLIPIFSVITVFAGISGKNQKIAAQLTGALPFFALGYALYNSGSDFINVVTYGGWGSLGLGLVLFILPRGMKQ